MDKDFSDIYLIYYSKLLRFAKEYVVSEEDAENIVQDMFLYLWENQPLLDAALNLNAYLFTLIKNRCIDFIRRKITAEHHNQKIQDTFEMELKLKLYSLESFENNILSEENIEAVINEAINSLPEKCRKIFILSRMDGLKYKEIAEILSISVNTVENQMSIALKKLKVKLKNYLPIYIFII